MAGMLQQQVDALDSVVTGHQDLSNAMSMGLLMSAPTLLAIAAQLLLLARSPALTKSTR